MSTYYRELMKGHTPAPDMICRHCGHAIEDHEWLGKGDSEQGGRGQCTKPGCPCKKFRSMEGVQA